MKLNQHLRAPSNKYTHKQNWIISRAFINQLANLNWYQTIKTTIQKERRQKQIISRWIAKDMRELKLIDKQQKYVWKEKIQKTRRRLTKERKQFEKEWIS